MCALCSYKSEFDDERKRQNIFYVIFFRDLKPALKL